MKFGCGHRSGTGAIHKTQHRGLLGEDALPIWPWLIVALDPVEEFVVPPELAGLVVGLRRIAEARQQVASLGLEDFWRIPGIVPFQRTVRDDEAVNGRDPYQDHYKYRNRKPWSQTGALACCDHHLGRWCLARRQCRGQRISARQRRRH